MQTILRYSAIASLWLACGLAPADEIKWHTSYADALAAAKRTGKVLFVDFYADW